MLVVMLVNYFFNGYNNVCLRIIEMYLVRLMWLLLAYFTSL